MSVTWLLGSLRTSKLQICDRAYTNTVDVPAVFVIF